ncbi:unnamed protein product, partial [Vitis vinifera]|uniref:Uncharacterized protein n=1 Tax=Vitis vinifera TaxID=29760 RepID=D7UAZ9_VITVI
MIQITIISCIWLENWPLRTGSVLFLVQLYKCNASYIGLRKLKNMPREPSVNLRTEMEINRKWHL